MKTIGKWLYFIGLLAAVVVALVGFQASWLSLILLLLGVLAAIFYFDADDIVNLGIRFLVLGAVKDAFGGIPAIGAYLSGVFGAVYAFLGPVVLTVLIVWFVRKYFFLGKK